MASKKKSEENFATRLPLLRSKAASLAQRPGVYLHKSEQGKILYVGKAKNLNARVRSYFTGINTHNIKTRALVEKIYDFEVIITESEYESLILENNLIKHNKPPYNILLRDDKTYPYLKIDLSEKWPRIVVVRRRKNDDALYFGPYTNSGYMYQMLSVINRFFPLVKCTPEVFKTVSRPCNYYDIKRCLGPCKLPVEKKEYQKHLDSIIGILKGDARAITKKIKGDIKQAAEALEFEKAALLRDQMHALEKFAQPQSIDIDTPIDLDVFSASWEENFVCFYVSCLREGKLIHGQNFVVKNFLEEPAEEEGNNFKKTQENTFASFLCQYYQSREVPRHILLAQADELFTDNKIYELSLYLNDLKKTYGKNAEEKIQIYNRQENLLKDIKTNYNKDNIKKKINDLCTLTSENSLNSLNEQVKIEESTQHMLRSLQEFFSFSTLPLWIECFDISTFHGNETVASQVVFKEGKPSKKDYRKYIIKETVGKTDDFASLREVIRRRFKEENRGNIPDLLLIDGGEPQIREVGVVLKNLHLGDIPFYGIAKSRTTRDFSSSDISASSERIVIPYREDGELLPEVKPQTKILREGSPEFRILTQLRNEAHRFAITFHRKRRDKQGLKSALAEIKGIGPKRKKQLLEIYPDLLKILEIENREISDKTGIPIKSILELKELLRKMSKISATDL